METFRELIRELCIGVYNDDVDTDEFIEKTCGMLDSLRTGFSRNPSSYKQGFEDGNCKAIDDAQKLLRGTK